VTLGKIGPRSHPAPPQAVDNQGGGGQLPSQEAAAVAELEAEEDDAEPDPDFESAVEPDVDGVDSELDLPLEPDSDLPLELDCSEPEWAELLARLSVR
jgi:hypothetical protein